MIIVSSLTQSWLSLPALAYAQLERLRWSGEVILGEMLSIHEPDWDVYCLTRNREKGVYEFRNTSEWISILVFCHRYLIVVGNRALHNHCLPFIYRVHDNLGIIQGIIHSQKL
jgi:hypothetical protein